MRRGMIVLSSLLILALALNEGFADESEDLAFLYAHNASGKWRVINIGYSFAGSAFPTSLTIDSNDNIHLVYADWDISYCIVTLDEDWDEEISCEIPVFSSDLGGESSIKLDSSSNAYIVFYDYYDKNLAYATNSSGDWQTFSIEEIGATSKFYASLAVDSTDNLHVSYLENTNNDLKYATNASGSWQSFLIDSIGEVGIENSIAVDSNDYVHISYFDLSNAKLKYATNSGGEWQALVINSASSTYLSTAIALDSQDKVHIAYNDLNTLKYLTNAFGDWETFVIDEATYSGWEYRDVSIAVDSNDKVHIAYCFRTTLKYATNASGNWEIFYICKNPDYYNTSIDLDSLNNVHISFVDYSDYDYDDDDYDDDDGDSGDDDSYEGGDDDGCGCYASDFNEPRCYDCAK